MTQRSGTLLKVGLSIALAMLSAGLALYRLHLRNKAMASPIRVTDGRLFTSTQPKVRPGQTVSPAEASEIGFAATLEHVPVGERIAVICEWIGPDDQPAYQERVEIGLATVSSAPVECRFHPFRPPSGSWTVRLLHAGHSAPLAIDFFAIRG